MSAPELFTDSEVRALLLATLEGAAACGVDEAEVMRVLDWAKHVRAESALLKMLLDGRLLVCWPDDGELTVKLREHEARA